MSSEPVEVISCRDCGFIHQNPIPYVDDYYDNDLFYVDHAPTGWLQRQKREYDSGLWNTSFAVLTKLLLGTSLFDNVLYGTLLRPEQSLLDVGCGNGLFMDYWSKHVNQYVVGIEPSNIAHKHSPPEIWNKIYKTYDEAPRLDDVSILMYLVLEHISDPVMFLRKYWNSTQASRMVIVVPNDFSPLQSGLRVKNHFLSPVHINYFTPQGLRNAIHKACGYNLTIKEYATFPMEIFEHLGIHYIGNDELGHKCHMLRLHFEKSLGSLAFVIYKILYNKFKWGRELMFVVERKNK